MNFTYTEYDKLMLKILSLGKTELFNNWNGEKVFLIRHDIDFDITLAHTLALREQALGVKSTYFVLTTSPRYNVLGKNNRAMLKEITSMGHEIGLHFDPSVYEDNLEHQLNKEVDVLSCAVDEKINSVSLHCPSIYAPHGRYPLFTGYVNAYDRKLFSDNNYISDSRMHFRGKNIYEFIEKIHETMIQILLHPMHYSESGKGYDEICRNAIIRIINGIDTDMSTNSGYKKDVPDHLLKTFNKY